MPFPLQFLARRSRAEVRGTLPSQFSGFAGASLGPSPAPAGVCAARCGKTEVDSYYVFAVTEDKSSFLGTAVPLPRFHSSYLVFSCPRWFGLFKWKFRSSGEEFGCLPKAIGRTEGGNVFPEGPLHARVNPWPLGSPLMSLTTDRNVGRSSFSGVLVFPLLPRMEGRGWESTPGL